MFDLPLNKATRKTVGTHQFYIFPKPLTHTNQRDRPPTYADPALLTSYAGTGSNGSAKLLPGNVHSAAHAVMSSLRRVGDRINDWSMKSAVVQSGFRPDDASQGSNYLRIIKQTIREKPAIFNELEFPSNLEAEAQSVLGRPGDARRAAFHQHLAAAPGWSAQLVARLFNIVDNVYAPGGQSACDGPGVRPRLHDPRCREGAQSGRRSGLERRRAAQRCRHVAEPVLDDVRLRLYNTDKEIWHQEFRSPKEGAGSPQAIELLNCCGQGLEIVDEALQYSEQAIREALKRIPESRSTPVALSRVPHARCRFRSRTSARPVGSSR